MTQSSETLAEQAVDLMQRDILAGALAPGARLAVHDLAARYGIGVTPLREALARLVGLGLVAAPTQRGFRVADVSRADLVDITLTRQTVEAAALRLSMQAAEPEWEAGILAALHLLRRQITSGPDATAAAFGDAHKRFHVALVAGCGSLRLLRSQSALYDEAHRYRRLMMTQVADWAAFLRTHEALADIVLSRDHDAAQAQLMAHIASTLAFVYPDAEATQ
jgi:GntR family transcriptional regulator, carbon starvation induced regulator